MEQDIMWIQRFNNFVKALKKLTEAIEYVHEQKVSTDNLRSSFLKTILKEGLIHRFEYTPELACKTMKSYIAHQENNIINSNQDAIKKAYQLKLIPNESVWIDMNDCRNKALRLYDNKTVDEAYYSVIKDYHFTFIVF